MSGIISKWHEIILNKQRLGLTLQILITIKITSANLGCANLKNFLINL